MQLIDAAGAAAHGRTLLVVRVVRGGDTYRIGVR